jgi:hypothetical protein
LCEFLGVDYVAHMVDPYADKEARMTDGIHPESRMQGDVKFHNHRSIDPAVASKWRVDEDAEAQLGEVTWRIAESLGYERPAALAAAVGRPGALGQLSEALVPQERPAEVPLSFAQRRLWFLELLTPGSPFYNIPFAARLQGPMSLATMRRVVNDLVARHEILRTHFVETDGEPAQVIAPRATVDVPLLELGDVSRSGVEERIQEIVKERARTPFDLARDSLVRVSVLRVADDDHVVMVNMHHIISDGWSLNVFVREAVTLYLAYLSERPSPLPPLTVQYADFSIWQRRVLQGELLEDQREYWRSRLEGIQPLELPTDRQRPKKQTHEGHTLRAMLLDPAQLKQLKAHSRDANCTLFMTTLAAFQALLHRYTGRDDIVVGAPTAGRDRTELESMIGFFVNMLVMRTTFAGNPTFRELQGRVREVVLGAFAHQELPFEQLVADVQPERDLSRGGLFQVAFALQNAPRTALKLADVTLFPLESTSETAKFDLTVFARESEEGLASGFNFSTELFDEATMERMAEHYRQVLCAVIEDPDKRVSDLSLGAEAKPDTEEPESEEFVL